MKIRKKITIIFICISLLFVILSSYIFENFFLKYIESQEISEVSSISKVLDSYIYEKTIKYLGSVNDWSHWDDTYYYLEGQYPTYAKENLMADTFENLGISFFIIVSKENQIKTQLFYDFDNNKFVEFPEAFEFEKILEVASTSEDASGIGKIGDQIYFVATSDITDSAKLENPNGKLIFGSLIDKESINTLENLTDSQITASSANIISNFPNRKLSQIENSNGNLLHLVNLNIKDSIITMEFSIPTVSDEGHSIQLIVTKTRNLFIGGMQQIDNFKFIYMVIMLLLILLIFLLLGKFLSKPFNMLIKDVKTIDIKSSNISKLKVQSKDEFAFLRHSINSLLNRIEREQRSVKESKKKLQLTLNSVGDGVITVDINGNIDFMNPIAERLTGWSLEEAHGNSFDTVFNIINEYTRDKVDCPVKKVFEVREIIELANHTILISKDGTERAIEDTAAPIINENDELVGVVLVFRDFSEKKEKNQRIEYLSYHDVLTGLYNRRFFEQELIRLDTNRNLPFSIVYADVNGLKTINDAFGHQYGDLLIQKVASVFKNECRADDIISRTGGDEFIMLLPKTSAAFAKNLVKRIQEKVEQEMIMDIKISVSFGWGTKEHEDQSIWEIMKSSEELMYQAKIYSRSSKQNAVIRSILNTLLIKSPREEAHSKRVSAICADIGKAYNLSDEQVNELKLAGELHDIGKISIDEIILNKPGKLTDAEWAQIQRHPETGYRLLATSSEFFNIAEYVRSHHEKWDGTGYPKGLKGEEIHWNSRVISLADSYDAMTSERPYRKTYSREEAAMEIKKNAGTQFDPEIARIFVEKVLGLTWESQQMK